MARRRKERSSSSEPLISSKGGEVGETQNAEVKKGGFFACYLLTSLSPRHKGHTYIGFTVNPRRRIRQHNGELRSGAWKTKSKRPWEMVLCIYGFPTNISALQFEWAWQHPFESLAVRKAAATLKSLGGLAGKIKLAYTMLTLPSWQSLSLTVNFFSTKYTKHSAGCPGLPEHTRVQVSSMEDLPCYTRAGLSTNEDEEDDCDYDQEINTTSSDDATMEGVIDMTVDSDGNPWKSVEDTNESHEMPSSSSSPNESDTLEDIEDTNLFQLNQPAAANLQKSMHIDVSCDEAPTVGPINVGEADEVIDLLTPSPAYSIKSNRNMRKFSADCPKIIDLTSSPIFV